MKNYNLHCEWHTGVDLEGLNPEDKKRISQVGIDKWLDEISTKAGSAPVTVAKTTKKQEVKAPKNGTKAYITGCAFLVLAQNFKDMVTYDQAEALHPTYPSDCAYYARLLGADVETDRKNKVYRVKKYPENLFELKKKS